MKKLILGLFVLNVSWTSLLAQKFETEYLDSLLKDPFTTLETQQISAVNFTKATGYDFKPEHLNLVGALARREYDLLRERHPLTDADVTKFKKPNGGHVEWANLVTAHRFEGIAKSVHERLRNIYKDKILEHPVRVINNVGGMWAVMEIYNCSTTEYVALFGSMFPQKGYSGLYPFMEVYDIMVDGKMVSHGIETDTTLPVTYEAGEISLLENSERRIYALETGAMMIDYGRGFIPAAMDQGIFTPYKNNKDFASMRDQVLACAKSFLNRIH